MLMQFITANAKHQTMNDERQDVRMAFNGCIEFKSQIMIESTTLRVRTPELSLPTGKNRLNAWNIC